MAQFTLTVNVVCAKKPVRAPSADIQCMAEEAEEGIVIGSGPNRPLPLVPASATTLVSKYMSTRSKWPNPTPETFTTVVGGPLVRDSTRLGFTMKRRALLIIPSGVVIEMGPEVASTGTVAYSSEADLTWNELVAPLNFTAVVLAKPDPWMVTRTERLEAGIEDGVKEVMEAACGVAAWAVRATAPIIDTETIATRRIERVSMGFLLTNIDSGSLAR